MPQSGRIFLKGIIQNWENCSSINAYDDHYKLAITAIKNIHDPEGKTDTPRENILNTIRDHRIVLRQKLAFNISFSAKKYLISEECKSIAAKLNEYLAFLELSDVDTLFFS